MVQKTGKILKNSISVFLIILYLSLIIFYTIKVLAQTENIEGTIQVSVCGNDFKEPLEQCDGIDLGDKNCTTLGFTGGSLSCMPSCQFLTSSCEISTDIDDAEEGIYTNESGGELALLNLNETGSTIEIPISAFSTDLSLFAFSEPSENISDEKPSPSGKSFVGNVYSFLFFDENSNRVQTLLNPATITISYLDSQISGLDEVNLEAYHFSEDDLVWHLIPGSTVNLSENTITFDSTSFSLFGIFSEPPVSDDDSDSSGSSSGGNSGGGFFGPLFKFFSPEQPESLVILADFNKDNRVDISDLSILLYYWDKTGSEIIAYDLDSSGMIDIVDVSILFYHWSI